MSTQTRIDGTIWLNEAENPYEPVVEGHPVKVDIERTDEDEVAIHATFDGDSQAVSSIYLTRAQATFIAAQINATALKEL